MIRGTFITVINVTYINLVNIQTKNRRVKKMSEFVTISVSRITREFFRKNGSKGESYDDVLQRMIPSLKGYHKEEKKES